MQPFCTNCFKPNATKTCSRCPRRYCCSECQVQDLHERGHEHICGKGGQLGKDYEIKPSPNNQGLGVFALRDFKMGEIVLQEVPMDTSAPNPHAAALLKATKGCGEEPFLPLMAHVDHSCIGNAQPLSEYGGGLITLKATRDISTGEEITYDYVFLNGPMELGRMPSETGLFMFERSDRMAELKATYGIDCQCKACTDESIEAKIRRFNELFKSRARDHTEDLPAEYAKLGAEKISLAKELSLSADMMVPMCMTLFKWLVVANRVQEAQEVAAEGYRYASAWYNHPDNIYRKITARMVSDPPRGLQDYSDWLQEEATEAGLNLLG